MKLLPPSLQLLVGELSRLPGVGEKAFQKSLLAMQEEVKTCPTCHFWTQHESCPVCTDPKRVGDKIAVVRDCPDVLALEKFRAHTWRYHVLQGFLAPLSGVGPAQIRLESLFNRIEVEGCVELILAFDATVEGDATALFIRDQLKSRYPHVRLTRMAMGLPAGSSVEYLDASTLESALEHRTSFE